MRTTVIPAQITTVEDKIAGNFNLTQILILMAPIFWTALVYTLFAPTLRLAWYKIPLILIVLFVCLILSLRINGKVVLNWLIILLTYNLRPSYYLFNKNDPYLRTLHMPIFEKKKAHAQKIRAVKEVAETVRPRLSVSRFMWFENFVSNPNYSISYKAKKGGINVALEQIQK